jgi:hypothetical protein
MNIFALHPDPVICASYHCDQHLHKMILESAQMLSTAMLETHPHLKPYLYRPTHINHPCTFWVKQDINNALWLIDLCYELESIRDYLGCDPHKSMDIVKVAADNLSAVAPFRQEVSFIFCGPEEVSTKQGLTVHEKYQEYYKLKQQQWLFTNSEMRYKNRPIPPFLEGII